jgi:large subunit ribosomal protein L19
MNKDEIIRSVESEFIKNDIPDFSPGDVIRVYERIASLNESRTDQVVETGRTQVFEGVVLKRAGGGTSEMFTVRKDSYGIGIEKVFPLHSPRIEKIELVRKGSVHQARPYYLRRKTKRKPRRRTPTEEEMSINNNVQSRRAESEVSEGDDRKEESDG